METPRIELRKHYRLHNTRAYRLHSQYVLQNTGSFSTTLECIVLRVNRSPAEYRQLPQHLSVSCKGDTTLAEHRQTRQHVSVSYKELICHLQNTGSFSTTPECIVLRVNTILAEYRQTPKHLSVSYKEQYDTCRIQTLDLQS